VNTPLRFLFLFPLLSLRAWAADLESVKLAWQNGEVCVDNGLISRRWKLVDGLPVPTSLVAYGREWLKPDGLPGIVPPGGAPKQPLTIKWSEESGCADPVEAPSRRGTLSVVGSDGCGYRWHLQVFAGCPAITCRVERVGEGEAEVGKHEDLSGDATGMEQQKVTGKGGPDRDLMERLPLAAMHAQLTTVDLYDRTDDCDNLAAEREWRLGPKQAIQAQTCLAAITDPLAGAGLALLKHAPLPGARPVKNPVDVIGQNRLVRLLGHGAGKEGEGYAWSVIAWQGGRWERAAVLHRLQERFRPYQAGRDGLLLSNTWGDRNRDARLNEPFIRAEIDAGAALGVDVCQVDLGWQKGVTSISTSNDTSKKGVWNGFWAADPEFWKPSPERFPQGMDGLANAARAKGMALGLWFAPDSSHDFANWEKDAGVLLDFYRNHGIRFIKVDGVKATTKAGELNLQRLFARVRTETQGELSIDLDVTAEVRPGYFGAMQVGPLFLENRYSDWGHWWPHATLRNLWQLAWYVPPQRLRIEFLNPRRNAEKYEGSPLAPGCYPAEYPFATTLVANPLAWMEVSSLPADAAQPIGALAAVWRKHRDELHTGTTLPIGECPSGAAWTGFCSVGENAAQVLVFRELTHDAEREMELPLPAGKWRVEPIAGSGKAVWREGRLHVAIPEPLHWIWVRLTLDRSSAKP